LICLQNIRLQGTAPKATKWDISTEARRFEGTEKERKKNKDQGKIMERNRSSEATTGLGQAFNIRG
jgi:hypothetical protein